MWSRPASRVCGPGALTQGSSKACPACPSALSRAACCSLSSPTRWCPTPWLSGSPSSAPRKRPCRRSTTFCCWPSAETTFLWAPATCSATPRWPWSWTQKRRCLGCSSSPWSNTWRSTPPSWHPNRTASFADIANLFITAFCATHRSPMPPMVWCWRNPRAGIKTGEWDYFRKINLHIEVTWDFHNQITRRITGCFNYLTRKSFPTRREKKYWHSKTMFLLKIFSGLIIRLFILEHDVIIFVCQWEGVYLSVWKLFTKILSALVIADILFNTHRSTNRPLLLL